MMVIILAKILVIVNILLCIKLVIIKYRKNSPFYFFFLILAALVIAPGLWDPLRQNVDFHPFSSPIYFDEYSLLITHFFICTYLFIFLTLETLLPSRRLPKLSDYQSSIEKVYYLPFFMMISIAAYLFLNFNTAIVAMGFAELREGKLSLYSLVIGYLSILSIFIAPYFWFFRKNKLLSIGALSVLFLMLILIGGSRQPFIISLSIMVIMFLEKRKFSLPLIILFFIVGLPALDVLLMIAKLLRNTTGIEARLDILSNALSGNVSLVDTSSEGTVRWIMYKIFLEPIPDYLKQFNYFLRTLLFWMPSFLDVFNIKPSDFEVDLFKHVMNGRNGTMHATYFGSTYADAGYFYPLWILLTFCMMRFFEFFISRSQSPFILWTLCVYIGIMNARGSLYAPLVVTFVAILLQYISYSINRIFKRNTIKTTV